MKKIIIGGLIFFIVFLSFVQYAKWEDKERIIKQKTITNYYGQEYNFIVTKKGYIYSVELENQGHLFSGIKSEYKKENIIPYDIIEIYTGKKEIHKIFLLTYKDQTQKIFIISDDPYIIEDSNYDSNVCLLLDIQDVDSIKIAYYPKQLINAIKSFLESDNCQELYNKGYPLDQLKKYYQDNQATYGSES